MATVCSPAHWPPARFRFRGDTADASRCLLHALFSRRLLRVSVPTAIVVGTVLTAINQGTVLADGNFPAELGWKIPLTYCVPFLVSSWGALRVSRLARVEHA